MGQAPPSYEGYDDEDVFGISGRAPSAARAGLPTSWRHYHRWMAGSAFAAMWILESWTSSGSFLQNLRSLWSLILALGVCYVVYKLCRPYSERLAQIVCVMGALTMLIARGS